MNIMKRRLMSDIDAQFDSIHGMAELIKELYYRSDALGDEKGKQLAKTLSSNLVTVSDSTLRLGNIVMKHF